MAAPALAPGLARKVKKAQECMAIRADNEDLLNALQALSDVYPENSTDARRRLKVTVERSIIATNDAFVEDTRALVHELNAADARFARLARSCDAPAAGPGGASATAALLRRCDALAAELAAVRRKSEVVGMFMRDYQLEPEDEATLREGDVEERFFEALARVRRVQRNCRALLHTHHQRAGLELLDAMASFQEVAYERLCKWVQLQCQVLTEAEYDEVHPLLATAAAALRAQPVLLRYCADEVATARHSAVFQAFLTALTRGGPGGLPKPLEAHAKDPRRYVGDMLAWVHQAIANERELLESLFGDPPPASPGAGAAAEAARAEALADGEAVEVGELLDKVFEGICRPLRVRVEQLLLAGPPLLTTFHVLQVLAFYRATLRELTGADTALTRTLDALRAQAGGAFREHMRGRTAKLLRAPPGAPRALTCAPEILALVDTLVEVADAYKGSMAAGLPGDEAASAFNALLDSVTQPLVEVCRASAATLAGADGGGDSPAARGGEGGAGLPASAERVYFLNCLLALWSPLSLHRACAPQAASLKRAIDEEAHGLADAEVARLLQSCGALAVRDRILLYTTTAPAADDTPPRAAQMAQDAELLETRVADAMRAVYELASRADAVPSYERLMMPRLRAEVSRRVAEGVAAAYREVVEAVADPESGYGDALAAALKPSAQVDALLGVQQQ